MNFPLMFSILGRILSAYSLAMVIPLGVAVYYKDSGFSSFLFSFLITGALGFLLLVQKKPLSKKMGIRDGFAIVGAAWTITCLLGALPFWFADVVPTYVDALFESVSGLTTTGASVIIDVEALPPSILLWRSLTHWLGGLGIIVFFIVLLPNTGFGTVHLFNAEVPGPLNKRIMPRIRDTAITLWKIYGLFTLILIILLTFAGMSFFDAVNHAFSTMATGGFSTKNSSIMSYNNLSIEAIMIFFIILAGGNFRMYLMAWRQKSFKPFNNTEFKIYLFIIFAATFLISGGLWLSHGKSPDFAFRHSLFQVVSLITGTGFASTDYDQWPSMTKVILFVLMFTGGCAGSTTGGMKISRLMLLTKSTWAELKRGVHPQIVSRIKQEGKAVNSSALHMVSLFFFLYVGIFAIASVFLAGTGIEPFDAMSAVGASLGNVGPGFGIVGPTTTFASISSVGKSVLALCMLLGRLEFFTLLILLRPEFWRTKKNW